MSRICKSLYGGKVFANIFIFIIHICNDGFRVNGNINKCSQRPYRTVHSAQGPVNSMRVDRGFWLFGVANIVTYSIDAPQRIVTKSLYRTAPHFLCLMLATHKNNNNQEKQWHHKGGYLSISYRGDLQRGPGTLLLLLLPVLCTGGGKRRWQRPEFCMKKNGFSHLENLNECLFSFLSFYTVRLFVNFHSDWMSIFRAIWPI